MNKARFIYIFIHYYPLIFYSGVSLLILGPLLQPGYILTLDMVFTPQMPWPDQLMPSSPFYVMLHWLSAVIPADIIQKGILFMIFTLAGLGMYRVVHTVWAYDAKSSSSFLSWTMLLPGLLYQLNPFTFTRFMVGHFAVLLGYMLLPWLVRSLLLFLRHPSYKKAITVAILFTIMAIFSIHTFAISLCVTVLITTAEVIRRRQVVRRYLSVLWRPLGLVFVLTIIGNSYWLYGVVNGGGPLLATIQDFTYADRLAFATVADSTIGLFGNVLALYGFWGDNFSLYTLPKDEYGWWLAPTLIIGTAIILGAITAIKQRKKHAIPLVLVGMGATIMTMGSAGHIFAESVKWLYTIFPLMDGFREPQKWSMLLPLVYACFLAYFFLWMAAAKGRLVRIRHVVAIIATFAILVATPSLFWGASGQLSASRYPDDWYKVNALLEHNKKVLFLPWHHYMTFGFAHRIVANPADHFFAAHIITNDDPELAGSSAYVQYPQNRTIKAILDKSDAAALANYLLQNDIEYVILAKEYDFQKYLPILQASTFQKQYDGDDIILYTLFYEKRTH